MSISRTLRALLDSLPAPDAAARVAARRRFDALPGGGGTLAAFESVVELAAAATGDTELTFLESPAGVIALGDSGIARRWPHAGQPTADVLRALLVGHAPGSLLARGLGIEWRIVDAGVDDRLEDSAARLHKVKPRRATGDISKGPAMAEDEAEDLLKAGIDFSTSLPERSLLLLSGGGRACEVASAALQLALAPHTPVFGLLPRPAGFDDIALTDARTIIPEAIDALRPRLGSPLSMLAALGNFEHAFLAGLMAGCTARRVVVLYGGIAAAAAANWLLSVESKLSPWLIPADWKVGEGPGTAPLLAPGIRGYDGCGTLLALSILRHVREVYLSVAPAPAPTGGYEVDIGALERTDGARKASSG